MIGRIQGVLLQINQSQVLVDVAGVGYEIDMPMIDLSELPSINHVIILFTHLYIREDAHSLFGFITKDRRDCFRELIKISGIGPRIGLALLSTLSPNDIAVAITNSDITTLCRTPGIGKKMAERMILELKGKFNLQYDFLASDYKNSSNLIDNYSIRNDIFQALSSLGYGDKEISPIIKQLPDDINDLQQAIKHALRILNKF